MFFLYFITGLGLFIAGYLARCWWQIIVKPKRMANKNVTNKPTPTPIPTTATTQRIPSPSKVGQKYEKWLGIGQ